MRYQTTQDFTSARTRSPANTNFDCELPPEVRAELEAPPLRRPRILSGTKERAPYGRLALAAVAFLLALGAIVNWTQRKTPVPEPRRSSEALETATPAPGWHSDGTGYGRAGVIGQSKPVTQPTPAPVVQPTPALPVSQPLGPPPPAVSVPRARLVKLPSPPKAQLVRLPQPRTEFVEISAAHVDETHTIQMPYGEIVRATLRGFLDNENQLPRVGHIGDMYVVGTMPWVWIQVPGTVAPTWIDP